MLQSLPFTASAGGGQLDSVFRRAITQLCGPFRPAYECDSLLQTRGLILQGASAGLLPSIGAGGLAEQLVVMREFSPLKDYGRPLVLHWNMRQMRQRWGRESNPWRIGKDALSCQEIRLRRASSARGAGSPHRSVSNSETALHCASAVFLFPTGLRPPDRISSSKPLFLRRCPLGRARTVNLTPKMDPKTDPNANRLEEPSNHGKLQSTSFRSVLYW